MIAPQSAAIDPAGDPDPFFPRYRAAVARNWWIIIVVAVVAGLAAAFLIGGTAHTTGARISVDRAADAVLEPVDLDTAVTEVPSIEELKGVLAAYDEPDDVDVAVSGTDSLVLVITSKDEATGEDVRTDLVDQLNAFVGERRAAVATSLGAVIASDRGLLEQRLADLDTSIAGSTGEQLRDAFLYERQNAVDDLSLAQRQDAALQLWAGNEGRTVVSNQPSDATDSRILWFVVGAILGGGLALVVVVLRSHLDHRVWTRSDVAAEGLGPVLPILPDDGPDRANAIASIRQASAPSSTSDEHLAVVAADSSAAGVAQDLVTQLVGTSGAELVEIGRLHEAINGRPTSVLLVAAIGSTGSADLTRGAEYVQALGADLTGVVLGGVGARGARRADS